MVLITTSTNALEFNTALFRFQEHSLAFSYGVYLKYMYILTCIWLQSYTNCLFVFFWSEKKHFIMKAWTVYFQQASLAQLCIVISKLVVSCCDMVSLFSYERVMPLASPGPDVIKRFTTQLSLKSKLESTESTYGTFRSQTYQIQSFILPININKSCRMTA